MKKGIFIFIFVFLAYYLFSITPQNFKNIERNLEKQAIKYQNSNYHNKLKMEKATTEYHVGDTKVFWKWDLSVMPPTWVQTPATCRAVGEHSYLFVADEDWQVHMDEADVQEVMLYLENQTMLTNEYGAIEMDIEHFGEIPDELDNDPKLIVFYSALGSFGGSVFDGYFSVYNQVTEEEAHNLNPPGHSNECEMIYMTCYPLDPSDPERISVLSHELQHLIHWGKDSNEDTWLNEGMSELAMVYFGLPDPISQFQNNPNNSLIEWNQTFADYVKTMLFFTYLEEHYDNGSLIKDIVADTQNSIQSIREQLTLHNINKSFEEIFSDWNIANFLDNPSVNDSLYYYSELNLPNFSVQATHSSFPASRTGTIKAWAAKYIKIYPGDTDLQISLQVNHPIILSAIRLPSQGNIPTVNKYSVSDTLTQFLPSILSDDYQALILVFSNISNSLLNYSYTISETGNSSGNYTLQLIDSYVYPNPINFSKANLKFFINSKSNSNYSIKIYDIKGRKITELKNNIIWDGKTEKGNKAPSGMYFYKISNSKTNYKIGKFLIIK